MGYQVKKVVKLTVALSLCANALLSTAQEDKTTQALSIPNAYIASDSEGFSTYKYRAGYLPLYSHGEKNTGISYQHNYFTQGSWDSSAEVYTLFTKAINPRTGLGYNLNASYNLQNGYRLFTTDSTYGLRVTDTTVVEAFINRDRVETQNSLNNGIYYTFPGISIEQQLVDRLSVVLMGGNMYFSDTNTRPTVKAKLIYDLVPDYGVTAQLRYRQYRDTNTSVANNYFNPTEYSETMIALGFRKFLSGWMLSGTAGVGRQTINQDPSTTTQLYEFAATSPVNSRDYYLKTKLGYGKSAGFLGPNYFYRYLMEELIIPF
jgi:hypothetical protein